MMRLAKPIDDGRPVDRPLEADRLHRPEDSSSEALLSSAEAELLLCCSRCHLDASTAERVRELLKEPLDWDQLLDVAWEHAVLLLLHHHLDALAPGLLPDAVPDEVRARLRQHQRRSAVHGLARTVDLVRLLKHFDDHGIAAIPFKGPILAATVYGDPALRQFRDLDIVVHQPDVARVAELLEARGFRLQLTGEQRELPERYRYQYPFVRDDGTEIEVHWGFAPRAWAFPIDLKRLWRRARTVRLASAEVRDFRPEDQLLILAAHAARHFFRRLLWICDLAELVRVNPDLDWEATLAEAEALGCRRVVLLALALAHDLLEAPLPGEILARSRAEPWVKELSAQVRRGLFDEWGAVTIHDQHVFYLRSRERRLDRLRYVALRLRSLVAPTATDRAFVHLPRPVVWLYFVLRPIRLVREHGAERLRPVWRMLGELLRR